MAMAGGIRAGRAYVEIYGNDSKLQNKLRQTQAKLRSFAASANAAGMGLARAGIAMAVPLALSARTFASFTDQMAEVRAVTGAAGGDFEKLTGLAKELGRTTSFTASEVAKGMTELGRAGLSANDILAGMPAILDLSRGTATEMGEAANIAAAAMRGFNLSAEDTTHIADVLSATANGSAQTLTDLGESMKFVAPLAYEAGATLEDTAAALAVLANNGIKGSMAGTSLARAYKNLSSSKAQNSLRDIGVAAADSEGNLRGLSEIMADIGRATQGMGSAKKLSIFEDLFGRGSAAALKLSAGTAQLDDMSQKLSNLDGYAKRTADTMDDTLGGGFRMLMSAVEGVQIAIGDALEPTLRSWASFLTELSGDLTAFVAENKDMIVTIGHAAVVVTGLGTAIIGIGTAASVASFALGGLSLALPLAPIAIAVGLGVALGQAFHGAAVQAAKLSDEMTKVLNARDQERQVDQTRLERLQQLASKQKLTNEEMKEASRLQSELQGKYGQLGISIDGLANSIQLAADAQEQLNNAMRDQRIADLQKIIDEKQGNIAEITREMQELAGESYSVIGITTGFRDVDTAHMEVLSLKASNARLDVEALNREIAKLKRGEGSLTGKSDTDVLRENVLNGRMESGATGSGLTATLQEREDAARRLAQINDQLARERRSDIENEIADIRALADEQKKLIQTMLSGEKDMNRIAELRKQLNSVDDSMAKRIDNVYSREAQEALERIGEMRSRIAGLRGGIKSRREREEADREMRTLIEADPKAAQEMIESMLAKAQEQELNDRDVLASVTAKAMSDGIIDKGEQASINEAMEALKKSADGVDYLKGANFRISDELKNKADTVQRMNIQTVSGGMGLSGIGVSSNSAQDRTAKASELSAERLKQIEEKISGAIGIVEMGT